MMSLMAGMEAAGGTFAPYNRTVRAETGRGTNQGFDLLLEDVNSGERASIRTRSLVNSAGGSSMDNAAIHV
jgi:glycerol-3-phosphate dehydrogenase